MKIQDVFSDQNEFIDSLCDHFVNDVALQEHDIVVQAIVPLADELNNGKAQFIVGIKLFNEKGFGADRIPLRVDVVAVNLVREIHFRIVMAIKRRSIVLTGDIKMSPIVKRLELVHGTFV